MYHDYNGREIEDIEMDNMRRDDREERQRNRTYYTLQWVLNVIQQVREAETLIDTGAVRFLLGVNSGVSDDFVNCAIRFEQEIQDIVAKEATSLQEQAQEWKQIENTEAGTSRGIIKEDTEETPDTQKCAICGNVHSVDDLEECPDCKRNVCENCTEYTREYETGAEIPECCKECYGKRCEAEYADKSPHIANLQETGDEDNKLHVQATPTNEACTECGKSPALKWNLYGMTGVLCQDCLSREVDSINLILREDEKKDKD